MAHWIRVSAKMQSMNVVQRCANTLNIHTAQALGHLISLWGWLSTNTDTGDVTEFTDDELEDGAGWVGQRGAFARFVREKHTDKSGRIRDWDEYMGPLVNARTYARNRQRERRAEYRRAQDIEVDQRLGRIPNRPAGDALCAYCETESAWCWDHVIPISLGGKHEKRNIVPACNTCNARKLNRSVVWMLSAIGLVSREQQDAWAERYGVTYALEIARNGSPSTSGSNGTGGRNGSSGNSEQDSHLFDEQMNGSSNKPRSSTKKLTEVDLRKSIRATGMYLGRELDIKMESGLDERALNSSIVINPNNRDASTLYGIDLVRAWCRRFYTAPDAQMLEDLQRLRAALRPAGTTFMGETIRATPKLMVLAMNETLDHPPNKDTAAVVFVLKKLQSGHLHEVRTAEGVLVTDALANEAKTIARDLSEAFKTPDLAALTAGIGKAFPTPHSQPNSHPHRKQEVLAPLSRLGPTVQ